MQCDVLLISGDEDLAVNEFNSQHYFQKLVSSNKSCEYYSIRGLNHSFLSPKTEYFVFLKMKEILEKFTKE